MALPTLPFGIIFILIGLLCWKLARHYSKLRKKILESVKRSEQENSSTFIDKTRSCDEKVDENVEKNGAVLNEPVVNMTSKDYVIEKTEKEEHITKMGHVKTEMIHITAGNYDKVVHSFIAFDTETTGLSRYNDVIIELGAVKFVDGVAVASYGTLINEGIPVPAVASRVNHITTEMLEKDGKNPKDAYKEFTDFLGDALTGDTFICAHNASFDMSFLEKALERNGYDGELRFIDTLSLSRAWIQTKKNYKLDTVAQYFGLINENSHRATDDAKICGEVLTNLLPLMKESIDREKLKFEKYKPTIEEKRVFSVIAKAMINNGCDISGLTIYRGKGNYVHVDDGVTLFRYKVGVRKSFVILPKKLLSGYSCIAPCTKSEDESFNARLVFNDAFDLQEYGDLFAKRQKDIKENLNDYINDHRHEYQERGYALSLSNEEIDQHYDEAKFLHLKSIEEQRLIEKQRKVKIAKQEVKNVKQNNIDQARIQREHRQKELNDLVQNLNNFRREDIAKIAQLSSQSGKRAVIQLNDNNEILRVYESMAKASEVVGVSSRSIRDAAKGNCIHAAGFKWKYADEYIKNNEL